MQLDNEKENILYVDFISFYEKQSMPYVINWDSRDSPMKWHPLWSHVCGSNLNSPSPHTFL